MNPQKEMIVIEKEHYYKTYMEQRQKLHVNLVQQLHLRAEAKKNHLLSKSNEIIDKFINYREEFLKNMPAELKSLKVKDYVSQSDGTLQVFLKQANNEGGLGNLYKLFQHEFEKVNNNQAQKPMMNFVYNGNPNDKQNSEQDDTVLEFIDSIKENTYHKPKFDLEQNKPSAMKSKVKIVATPIKSTKKRKFDQITSAGKENINLGLLSKSKALNNGNGTAKKVLLEKTNTMKIQPIPSQSPLDISPNKRPWMP